MPLYITRSNGQSVTLIDSISGNEVVITAQRHNGHTQFVIDAPPSVSVFRTEKITEPAANTG